MSFLRPVNSRDVSEKSGHGCVVVVLPTKLRVDGGPVGPHRRSQASELSTLELWNSATWIIHQAVIKSNNKNILTSLFHPA
jgi:hypothetical protein